MTLIELIVYLMIVSTTVCGLIDLALTIQLRESYLFHQIEIEQEYDLIDGGLSSHLFNQ